MKAYSMKAGVAVLALVLLFAMAAPAMAADSVTVNAEVDVDPYSIVLDEGASLDYGMLEVGESSWMTSFMHNIVIRNDGGAAVKLAMIGTDASNGSGGSWELEPLQDADQFRWELFDGAHYQIVDEAATTIVSSLDPASSAFFETLLFMPTSTSGYGTYHWSGTIYASAP